MTEYELTNLFLADAQLIEELPSLMLDDPFSDGSLNHLLDLTKQELGANRSYKTAGLFAKKEFMRLTGQESTLKAVTDHRGNSLLSEQYDIDIKEAWDKRKFGTTAQQVLIDISDGASSDEIAGKINKALDDVEDSASDEDEQSISDATNEVFARWKSIKDGDTSHMTPTGIKDIDDLIIGFPRGELGVIGARPSVGKTALGLTCMSNQDHMGIHTGVLSLEMKTSQLIERLGQIRSGVSAKDYIKGCLGENQQERLVTEVQRVSSSNMQIMHTNNRRLGNVKRLIRRMKKRDSLLQIVYIDYLQIITTGDKKMSDVQDIAYCCKSITALAHELKISIVCLAQLNRDSVGRPVMRHLKGSGQIEQDAYIAILIDRDVESMEGDDPIKDCAYIIAKNRDGETGIARGKYLASTTKFEEYLHGEYRG